MEGGIHFDGDAPRIVHGDIVGGDKITTIVSAAVRPPITALEKAEEVVLDATELAFGEARDLLKALRQVRKAQKAGRAEDVAKALGDLEKTPRSQVIIAYISELKGRPDAIPAP